MQFSLGAEDHNINQETQPESGLLLGLLTLLTMH